MSLQLHSQVLGTNPQPIDARLLAIIQNLLDMQFNPFQSVLVVTGAEFHDLQEKGRAWIAEHLSDHLQKDVLWAQDGTRDIDRYFVGPPEDFISGNRMLMNIDGRAVLVLRPSTQNTPEQMKSVKGTKSPAKEKISRPPNAYILYRTDHHKLIKAANPDYSNNQISKVLGAAWKEEKPEIRNRYHQMADEVKEEFMRAHPDYRYAPRRPGERRRRNKRDPIQPSHHEAMSQPINIATKHAPDLN